MSGRWQEAAEQLRQQIGRERFVLVSVPHPVGRTFAQRVGIPARFALGQRVRWYEGRTRKTRQGFIHAIYQEPGWLHEYDVQLVKRDGTAGRISRKYQSELEAEGDL